MDVGSVLIIGFSAIMVGLGIISALLLVSLLPY